MVLIMVCDTAGIYLDKPEMNKLLLWMDTMLLQIKVEDEERTGFLHSLNLSTGELQA